LPDDKSTKSSALSRLLGSEGELDPEMVEEFSEYLAQKKVDARQRWMTKDAVVKLHDVVLALRTETKFKEGDVVRWKKQLKNKNMPPYDVPVVIVQVLPEPVLNSESSSGSTYFREPLDIVVALYVESDSGGEDSIGLYYFDSRRFEPHPDFSDINP
jgi:hypothetical protein